MPFDGGFHLLHLGRELLNIAFAEEPLAGGNCLFDQSRRMRLGDRDQAHGGGIAAAAGTGGGHLTADMFEIVFDGHEESVRGKK